MMEKKIFRKNIFIQATMTAVIFLLLVGSSLVSVAAEVDYTSLYTYYGRPFYTYGSGDITCAEGLLNDERYQSCEERDDRNKYFYTLTGYKEIHDLTDSRVICQRDESLGGCSPDSSVSFSFSYPMGTLELPKAFRLYIPPGTVRVNLSIKMNNSSREGIVLRYQDPPDCIGWPYDNYNAVPGTENANAGLEEMKAGDVYKPNPGGSIFAVPITSFSAPLSEDGAGWLYVRKLGLDRPNIRTVTFNVTVDTTVFLRWYNRMVEQQGWDVNGDPPEVGMKVAGDYIDQTECEDAAFYWYDDCDGWEGCHAEVECNRDNLCGCYTDPDCEAAGGYYWNDDTCHVEACTAANLGDCDSREKCDDSGFFWYQENEEDPPEQAVCNEFRACTTADGCNVQLWCEGSGFNWYEVDGVEGCYAAPECNVNNIPGCKDKGDCDGVDGYWYENEDDPPNAVCNGGKACETADDSNCDTKLKCESSGFYWYDGACTSESPCGSGNLAGCTNQEDCERYGGVGAWHEDAQTSSGSKCWPPTSSSNSGTSSIFEMMFKSQQPNVVNCGSDNLKACDQQGCARLGAGYWWYDGSCRVDERQQDYNGRIEQAPVRLGADADDGSIDAGDGLSIVVDIPAGKRGYALLVFPHDLGYYFIDSTNIINEQLVSLVTDGAKKVVVEDENLCADLEEAPEFKGEWLVAVLTVPIAAPEFSTLDDIAAYMNGGGLYSFGSYSINVHCQAAAGCGSGDFSACVNESDCKNAGGKWINYQTSGSVPVCVKN